MNFICSELKKAQENQHNYLKKRKSDKNFNDVLKKKSKFTVEKNEKWEIIYPIIINNSLKLLNIGTFVFNRKNKYIFFFSFRL